MVINEPKYEVASSLRWYQYSLRSLLLVVTLFAFVCSWIAVEMRQPRKRRHHDPEIDAVAVGRAALDGYDQNNDGKLDSAELDRVPSLKMSLKYLDSNHDNAVSANEITMCIENWQEKGPHACPLTCIVTHNQQPLKDVNVKFVPENFFQGPMEFQFAEGHTDFDGVARMHSENLDLPPFVLCGFYRVEISKTGEYIPEKFNTRTILGVGVLWNVPNFPSVIRFDLEY